VSAALDAACHAAASRPKWHRKNNQKTGKKWTAGIKKARRPLERERGETGAERARRQMTDGMSDLSTHCTAAEKHGWLLLLLQLLCCTHGDGRRGRRRITIPNPASLFIFPCPISRLFKLKSEQLQLLHLKDGIISPVPAC